MSDDTQNLGLLLHDAARLIRRRFEARASDTGLSSAQWRLLVRVVKEPGVAQARLAELLEIEPISVSRLIDRMVDGDWLERRPDPADRRVRQIFPTDRSRAAFGAVKSVANEVYSAALAGMQDDARAATMSGLRAIIANLSDGEATCSRAAGKAERP